jgi:hypothetical protein
MKVSKNFKKVADLAEVIKNAKEESKSVLVEISEERSNLDTLESHAKSVLKL